MLYLTAKLILPNADIADISWDRIFLLSCLQGGTLTVVGHISMSAALTCWFLNMFLFPSAASDSALQITGNLSKLQFILVLRARYSLEKSFKTPDSLCSMRTISW